jgi:hypothetical protein
MCGNVGRRLPADSRKEIALHTVAQNKRGAEPDDDLSRKYRWVGAIANAIIIFTERVGLAVFLFLVGVVCFDRWSTAEQDHRLVEMLVFGNGIHSVAPFVAATVLFLAVLSGQQKLHKRKVDALQAELDRVAGEKSALQQQLAAPNVLQHADSLPTTVNANPKGTKAKS